MKKKQSKTWRQLCTGCRFRSLDEKDLFTKAKLLLMIYRNVCWATIGRTDELKESLFNYYGNGLDTALSYLEIFAPDQEKERFAEQIDSLFETRWLVKLIEEAMRWVKEYPDNGEVYFQILSVYYLDRNPHTDSELMETLGMERSTYYERKKEAVLVFAFALWGVVIPRIKKNGSRQVAERGVVAV